jgi:uncharacterized protein YbjT (DUF2867 family)
MILVTGGTGRLGQDVVRRLTDCGLAVRVMTRHLAKAESLAWPHKDLIEIVAGDVRDAPAVERGTRGVAAVISAMHGFAEAGLSPKSVDWLGNRTLIQAAVTNRIQQFVLLSIHDAAPDHPLELFRMKYKAEQELRASQLPMTILRPTAYMETWAQIVGEPLLKSRQTRVFGRGKNPINFVSVRDVARYVEQAVIDPGLRGQMLELGGPENLTMLQFVQTFQAVTGAAGKVNNVPVPMLRLMSWLLRPVVPSLARQMQAAVVMDTQPMAFDLPGTYSGRSDFSPTRLADVVRLDYGGRTDIRSSKLAHVHRG